MFCSKCGADNPDDAIFCKSCGTKFIRAEDVKVESEPSSSNYEEPNNKKRGIGTYIGCCCACLIILWVIGSLL